MSMRPYRPRRATKRWQEGAPEYVLDCFDNKGQSADRYTVLFGGSLLHGYYVERRQVQCLYMSDAPSSPQGVSIWASRPARIRPAHQRIRWLDLPEHIRKHVISRAEED